MKLTALFAQKPVTLSFEVFPPKTDASFESVRLATERIAALKPDFMSVTYGAGGSNSKATVAVAKNLIERYAVPVTAALLAMTGVMLVGTLSQLSTMDTLCHSSSVTGTDER